MYADDITVFLTDVNDIKCVLDILRKFSKVSGLKLNSTKTEAMWIGSNKKCKRKPVDLRWKLYPCNNVKVLGVNFNSTTPLNEVHQNWDSKVDKINNIIKVWKMILSNIYPTNIFLAKIGKARSSKCSKCDVEDYLEHFLLLL